MTAPVILDEAWARAADEPDIDHLVCDCTNGAIALCGTDVSAMPYLDDDPTPPECVVCRDLEFLPCGRCGA